ncbi:MAG: SEC-C domain-containing protein [Proteobacteria bacterium]|nr:SEC-C domain-containing protein [Pseudomonadota bacterium]
MSTTTTPRRITKEIETFCAEVNPSEYPSFVKVLPSPHSSLNECFHNVREQVRIKGGKPVYGWTIWEWPKVLLEAEFHCVWKSPYGELSDISPKTNNENEILFVRDDRKTFDFSNLNRVNSHRLALNSDPMIHDFIRTAESIDSITPSSGMPDPPEFIVRKLYKLKLQICKHYTNKNGPCICGSGKIFKKCCFNKIP